MIVYQFKSNICCDQSRLEETCLFVMGLAVSSGRERGGVVAVVTERFNIFIGEQRARN